jgi:hypothetical protein
MQQKLVNLVGKDELFEGHKVFAQRLDELNGLAEGDVAIVIALDQQHR